MSLIERINNKILAIKKNNALPMQGVELKPIAHAQGERKYHYLVSAAGYPNLGDEWIAYVWIKKILDQDVGNVVIIDVLSIENFSRLFKQYIDSSRLVAVHQVWRMSADPNYQKHDLIFNLDRVNSELEKITESNVFSEFTKKYKCVESVHILGGGYINDIWSSNTLILPIVTALRNHYHCSLSWTGACIAPLSDDKLVLLGDMIRGFDFISVRDKESYSILKTTGIENLKYGYDDVYLGFIDDNITRPENKPGKPQLIINIQGDIADKDKLKKQIYDVSNLIEKNKDNFELVYWEGIPAYDSIAYKILSRRFGKFKKISMRQLLEATIGIQKLNIPPGSFVVSSRFHIHFYLSFMSIDGYYLLAHEKYYDIKHNSLCDRGSDWRKLTENSNIYSSQHNFDFADITMSKQEDFNRVYEKTR